MADKRVTVFITKYALTSGVKMMNGTIGRDTPSMVSGYNIFDNFHGEGKEWHRTWNDAHTRAEVMRLEKIASLRAQIKRLEAMTFTEPTKDTQK